MKILLESNCDFGHAETGNGAKKRVVLRREIFRSNFKESESGLCTKTRFLASDFLFTRGNFTLIFTVSLIFGIGFFSKWFSQSIQSSFQALFLFEPNFHFSLVVFLFKVHIKRINYKELVWIYFLRHSVSTALFLGDTGIKYKDRVRSKVFNLKDKKNPELKTRVIKGQSFVLT